MAAQFGDEVAVDLHGMTEEQRAELDKRLQGTTPLQIDSALVQSLVTMEEKNVSAGHTEMTG